MNTPQPLSPLKTFVFLVMVSMSLVGCGKGFHTKSLGEGSSSASATPGFFADSNSQATLGEPEFFCEAGGGQATRSEDEFSLSILFEGFQNLVGAGTDWERGEERVTSCRVRIPLGEVPVGTRLAIFSGDLRAFGSIPEGGQGSLDYRIKLVDLNRQWRHHLTREYHYEFSQGLDEEALVSERSSFPVLSSPCIWEEENLYELQIEVTTRLQSNQAAEQALIQVESLDMKSEPGRRTPRHIYQKMWQAQKCGFSGNSI